MEKGDIINSFLEKGMSLEPSALEFFYKNQEQIHRFFDAHNGNASILTLDYIRTVLPDEGTHNISVSDDFLINKENGRFSADHAFSVLSKKYMLYRNSIIKKLSNTVSVNRIQNQPSFSLICIIQEKLGETAVTAEDPTGRIRLVFEDANEYYNLIEGDIVGVVCKLKSGGVYAERVVFPDIPLKRDVKYSAKDTRVLFLSKEGADLKQAASSLNDNSKDRIVVYMGEGELEEPVNVQGMSVITIDGIKIVVCCWKHIRDHSNYWGKTEDVIINLIKRRDVRPGSNLSSRLFWARTTFMDVLPDIFVTNNHEDVFHSNYKGTTIVSAGNGADSQAFEINLRTREINKVGFS